MLLLSKWNFFKHVLFRYVLKKNVFKSLAYKSLAYKSCIQKSCIVLAALAEMEDKAPFLLPMGVVYKLRGPIFDLF